jgi:1A family penicillin-binding protein
MRREVLVGLVVLMAAAVSYAAVRTVAFTVSIADELERAVTLAQLRPRAQATIVYDRHENPAFSFYTEQRTDVSLDQVSRHMIAALLSVEDRRFYSHHGLDPIRIGGAAWRNMRAGRIIEGGSTVTQQLARATVLTRRRTFERKLREALIALRLEERYSKARILEEYLNTVYFGEGFYGVEAASRGYFRKSAAQLEPAEAALLAALVRAPSTDAPCLAPERAIARRNLVLRLMRQEQHISDADLAAALKAPIPDPRHDATLQSASETGSASGQYFQEEVRRQLFALFGAERVLQGGLRVYSTYDSSLQAAADAAVTTRIQQIAKRRPRAKDLQGSLVAIEPRSGDVLALVGGRSFDESPFNRATQAHRQAGSAFKPIIYAAALERGYAPGSLLRDLDSPLEAVDGPWLPSGEHEANEYTLRRGLKLSSNRAAAQLLRLIGLGTTVYYAQRLGIASELPMVPSLALGTGEVTLMELTSSYGAFANRGRVAKPRLITRVTDAQGQTLWRSPQASVQAISETTAYLMSSMLADVVSSGTATGVRAAGFRLPAAGKTGTTDDYTDAWFIGYTPSLVAGVWFGMDVPTPIMSGGFAGVVAVPAWASFMQAATKGARAEWYATPPDVERIAICRRSGARATEACRHPELVPVTYLAAAGASVRDFESSSEPPVYEDLFPVGSGPTEICPIHNDPAHPLQPITVGTDIRRLSQRYQ